jgi:hypothetical protein
MAEAQPHGCVTNLDYRAVFGLGRHEAKRALAEHASRGAHSGGKRSGSPVRGRAELAPGRIAAGGHRKWAREMSEMGRHSSLRRSFQGMRVRNWCREMGTGDPIYEGARKATSRRRACSSECDWEAP